MVVIWRHSDKKSINQRINQLINVPTWWFSGRLDLEHSGSFRERIYRQRHYERSPEWVENSQLHAKAVAATGQRFDIKFMESFHKDRTAVLIYDGNYYAAKIDTFVKGWPPPTTHHPSIYPTSMVNADT